MFRRKCTASHLPSIACNACRNPSRNGSLLTPQHYKPGGKTPSARWTKLSPWLKKNRCREVKKKTGAPCRNANWLIIPKVMNDEARMTKSKTNPNAQMTNRIGRRTDGSSFDTVSSFG